MRSGNSLAVQWLGLGSFTVKDPGSMPGQGTKISQLSSTAKREKEKKWDLKDNQVLNGSNI